MAESEAKNQQARRTPSSSSSSSDNDDGDNPLLAQFKNRTQLNLKSQKNASAQGIPDSTTT
jgi:hypothetical protein